VFTVQSELQECIEQLQAWSLQWDMKLNVDKTKVMLFSHHLGDRLSLSLDGVSIEQVTEFKYLGVILDEQLKFDAHVDYAATKARKAFAKVSMLFQGRKGISECLGLELYKTLVRPHMEFPIPAWATMTENGIRKLEKVQSV